MDTNNRQITLWIRLYKAAQEGDVYDLLVLFEEGVDISFQHPDFVNSPLIAAAQNGYLEVVKCLIAKGADPHYLSKVSRKTAKDYAKERGYLSVFNYLEQLFPVRESYQELLTSFSLN